MKDALPYITSSSSVTLMKDLILRKEVSQSTAEDWLFLMAFIPRPDENMLEPMVDLLKHGSYEPSISFTVSVLTRSYCVQNKDCIYNENVGEILSILENRILSFYGAEKMDNDKNEEVSGLKRWSSTSYFV